MNKPGDIMFLASSDPLNFVAHAVNITQTNTLNYKSKEMPYHTAIVISDYQMIESTWGHGVRKIDIDHYRYGKHNYIWHKRLKDEYWPENKSRAQRLMIDWLTSQIGKQYDRRQLIGIFWRSFLRIVPPVYRYLRIHTNHLDSKKKFICSELVFTAYILIGLNIYPPATSGNITPHDLNRSPFLETV